MVEGKKGGGGNTKRLFKINDIPSDCFNSSSWLCGLNLEN